MNTWRRLAWLALLLSLSLGCDQVTKKIAMDHLQLSPPRSYLGNLIRLEYAENPGSFLSLGAGLSDGLRFWLLTGGLGIFLLGILAFVLLNGKLKPPVVTGLALILGGGFGNWADRLAHGNVVVDFMNVGVGPLRTGVFNVADVLIQIGVVLLLVASFRSGPNSSEIESERQRT